MKNRQARDSEAKDHDRRRANGAARRKQAPRSSHGDWEPAADRPDPLSLLRVQDKGRLQHLLPIKYGRMVVSPFGFLRGSAAVMAADLADTPVSGIDVVICGDAHLLNFGFFATPERSLVFDLNDFDEAYHGPWEWDVKRLAASAVVVGRQNGFTDEDNREMAVSIVRAYGEAISKFSKQPLLDVWYFQMNAEQVVQGLEADYEKQAHRARSAMKKARGRTHQATLDKLTESVDGGRRFVNNPPLLVRLEDMLSVEQKGIYSRHNVIEKAWSDYLDSLPEERKQLAGQFHVADVALRAGGVGSIGTRCGIVLLEGRKREDAIILQFKEAGPSVVEAFLQKREYSSPAHRVVVCQRLLQAASDIFLGWHEGVLFKKHYYWRQLKDMKGSIPVEALSKKRLSIYLQVCSQCLARAHARTGDPAAIAGYMGKAGSFSAAIGDFAIAYADQTERDHMALVEGVKSGRIKAEVGI